MLVLRNASAEAMAHAAAALQSQPTVSLALVGALGHLPAAASAGPAAGVAHRARNGLQEEVRQLVLQRRREQRGAGVHQDLDGSASAGPISARRVPLIRSVFALHPAAVDLEVLVQAAACQTEDTDEAPKMHGVPSLDSATQNKEAAAETQTARDLLRRALLDWIFHRLGMESERVDSDAAAHGSMTRARRRQTSLQVTALSAHSDCLRWIRS